MKEKGEKNKGKEKRAEGRRGERRKEGEGEGGEERREGRGKQIEASIPLRFLIKALVTSCELHPCELINPSKAHLQLPSC